MPELPPPFVFDQDPSNYLEDLLIREAALSLAHKGIVAAAEEAQERLRVANSAKSLVALVSSEGRKRRRDERQEAQEALDKIGAGLQKLDTAEMLLIRCLDESLENYLREYDTSYINGLAASRFPHDWQRITDRFDQAAETLHSIFQSVAKVFAALPPYELCVERMDSRQLLWEAANIARRVDEEVRFINKVADAQRVRGDALDVTLARQPEIGWAPMVATLLSLNAAEALAAVNGLASDARATLAHIRAAIAGEGRLATTPKSAQIPSYHALMWASRREAALLKIELQRLGEIVEETEMLIDTGKLAVWQPSRTPSAARYASPVPASAVRQAPLASPRAPTSGALALPRRVTPTTA